MLIVTDSIDIITKDFRTWTTKIPKDLYLHNIYSRYTYILYWMALLFLIILHQNIILSIRYLGDIDFYETRDVIDIYVVPFENLE